MCIIAYAPNGGKIQDETIKMMFRNNPHGAGFMYKSESGLIEIRKGFMTADDLLEAYHEIPADAENAVHCRLATSGRISVDCCHPFPVRADTRDMKKENDSAEIAVMHNGTITSCTPAEGMKSDCSDTMIFTAGLLSNLKTGLDNPYVKRSIEKIIGESRLLIFREEGGTLMFGRWYKKEGIFYSKDGYADCRSRFAG